MTRRVPAVTPAAAGGGQAQTAAAAFPAWGRRAVWAVAAGRVALGLSALARPSAPSRPWIGAAADGVAAQVLGRALGARDVALGLGALTALRHVAEEPAPARAWVAAGALSDALDVATTLSAWRGLPRTGRWLVAGSAAAAALTGAAGVLAIRLRPTEPGLHHHQPAVRAIERPAAAQPRVAGCRVPIGL